MHAATLQLLHPRERARRFRDAGCSAAEAAAAGFDLERRTALDPLVAPNVKRLERLVGVFVRWPWLARRLLARLNPVAMRNMLAGYLMGPAMERGIWTYLELVLRKRA